MAEHRRVSRADALRRDLTPQTHIGRRGGIAAAVLAAACAAGIFVVHTTQMPRGGIMEHNEYLAWNDAESHDTLADAYAEFINANRCLMFSGLYQYTVRGAVVTIWPQTTADTERIAELDAYYAAHPKQAADTPMTGAFAGKNLILIMMESVDDWLVTPEYMPNLYRLEQEGVYFGIPTRRSSSRRQRSTRSLRRIPA